ncbi:MAG: fumarylacetoacetate hydrolase family protein [Candidatus Eremiobacteraeota bacterium]|nr:fumarylacetoacetate hydrolase family protein [Candidatus Eremiobacteraeota bacterium]MBV8355892.1 fumarylacetoacetate hydrolase family protein [Candidatus Eremiobacteraeota bacterium]
MRIVSFRKDGGPWRAGIEREGTIVDVARDGDPSVRALLAAGPAVVDGAGRTHGGLPRESVEIGPPVPDPEKIVCIGLNYKKHAAETGIPLPPVPTFFPKYRNSLIAHGQPIVIPRVAKNIDYEVELAAIIGRRCVDISEADALDYVAGYAAFNDVSARDLQFQTSQWAAGKAIDTFAPFGPAMVTTDEIPDPQVLGIQTRVNGIVVQDSNTSDMAFSVAQIIAFLSGFMTLEPGDVIATGTPEGVAMARKPPTWLKDGDVVEIEIEKIGIVRNPLVSKVPAPA